MTPEQLVPTRDLCQKLVDNGIVLDTHFVWIEITKDAHGKSHKPEVVGKDDTSFRLLLEFVKEGRANFVPAPTAEELINIMPIDPYKVYSLIREENGVIIFYDLKNSTTISEAETLASALAEVAIKVKEV